MSLSALRWILLAYQTPFTNFFGTTNGKEPGVKVSFTANYDSEEKCSCDFNQSLAYVDVLIPAEIEASAISREEGVDSA
jgi:hypothetical protein